MPTIDEELTTLEPNWIDTIFYTDGRIGLVEPADLDEGWTNEELQTIIGGYWTMTPANPEQAIICLEGLEGMPPQHFNERASRHALTSIYGVAMLVWRTNLK